MKPTPVMVDAPRAEHGEGPVWDAMRGLLFWVDMLGKTIHALQPTTGRVHSVIFPDLVCALAPAGKRGLLVAFAKQLGWVSWPSGQVEPVVEVEPDRPGNRCNDGKLDPSGRFWIGTMSRDGAVNGAGALYRLEHNGKLTRVLTNVTIANGMGWSPDARTMYFIDSPTREVWAFDFDASDSSISGRRTIIQVPQGLGMPDGMTVDCAGCLWIAHWGAGCVVRWDPTSGNMLAKIETGCPYTSSCAFSGNDNTDLFITTSRLGLDRRGLEQAPRSGALFRVNPCVG